MKNRPKGEFTAFTPLNVWENSVREANTAGSNAQVFRGVTILRAGMGNKRDRHVYTPSAMREGVSTGLFKDLRAFIDHPTSIDEQVQPERTFRDLVGIYRDARFVEEDVDGPARIVADLHVLSSHEWLSKGIRDLIEMGAADRAGISILGSGRTSPDKYRLEEGDEIDVQRVDKFLQIRSADIVTQAGAGGGFMNLLEAASEEQSEMKTEEILKQIQEAATAGDVAKVRELSAQLQESDPGDENDAKADTKEADEKDEEDEDEDKVEETKVAEKTDAVAEGTDAVAEKEDCDCPCKHGDKMAEAKGDVLVKKGKRKDMGRKFGESDAATKTELVNAEAEKLREENAQLKEKLAAVETGKYIARKLRESKLPVKSRATLATKLAQLTERADIDAEIKFQEAMFGDLKEAALSDFEEVEGAGGRSQENLGTGDGAVSKLTEAIKGSGLRLKTRK
jgi:hypothetical protein